MNNMVKARAVLAALPRCAAKSRQSGVQCKNPGLGAGGKCRFHGGASTGRPPTHGRTSKKAKLQRDWIRVLLAGVIATQGGKLKWFKPGRLSAERVQEVLNAKRAGTL